MAGPKNLNKRYNQFNVRVTDNEKQAITEAANRLGMTPADYVRQLVFNGVQLTGVKVG